MKRVALGIMWWHFRYAQYYSDLCIIYIISGKEIHVCWPIDINRYCTLWIQFFILAPALYKYISGCSLGDIDIANDEVANEGIRALLEKVHWY